MSHALRIAVVGAGIGVEHIKGYQELPELFDLKVLCDIQVERAAAVAEKYGIQEVSGSFEEVCRRSDIDVIDICTPPGFHLGQIQAGLKAGKHVFCEKPLVGSLDLVTACKNSNTWSISSWLAKRSSSTSTWHGGETASIIAIRGAANEPPSWEARCLARRSMPWIWCFTF
jgi:hypothetical protein